MAPMAKPDLSAETKKALLDYWECYKRHHDEIQRDTEVLALKIPEFAPVVKAQDEATRKKQQAESFEHTRQAMVEDNWGPLLANMELQGAVYARMGISFHAWTDLITLYRPVIQKYLQQDYLKAPDKLIAALIAMDQYLDVVLGGIGEAYLATKEMVIRKQEESIRELSTPVLKIQEQMLILPIIGIIDTQRARQITESLLKAVRSHRARCVVMDITGVPVVDSKVASHLVQTVAAAKLMGATVVVTGISPEIAQTLVTIGADLSEVATFGDLQAGLEEAHRQLQAATGAAG